MSHTSVVDASILYVNQTRETNPIYSCAAGDTPLGYQCITLPNPEEVRDINLFPCLRVENVAGRHIEVLVSNLHYILVI